MEAHRIDRFGSIDGIVLRSSEDPPARAEKEILMRVRARVSLPSTGSAARKKILPNAAVFRAIISDERDRARRSSGH